MKYWDLLNTITTLDYNTIRLIVKFKIVCFKTKSLQLNILNV